jgi:UDP-2,4-diacetamido-2,4,6-trideoxy-beta-L-altropyranose hydrolase
MNKNKIYFRADGSTDIGLGHVIRSLALADMLKEEFDCIFVTRFVNDYIIKEVEKSCSSYIKLSEKKNKHFEEFITHIKEEDTVVLDNYFFTTEYQKQIKSVGCKLICVDDMHDKHYFADVVINHVIGLREEQFSIESYTKLRLGWDYALLRKPFLNVIPRKRIEQKRCLVCIGGADNQNITSNIVKLIEEVESIEIIDVILGSTFLFKKELEKVISNSVKKVNIFSSLSSEDMLERMQIADFGILPASSISLEAIAVGMPFLVGYYADNQEGFYYTLTSMVKNIGIGNLLEIRKINDSFFKKAINKIDNKTFDSESIRNIFIDSEYPNKINEVSFINYIELNRENAVKVLEYRNQEDVRKWMINDRKISLKNHLNFVNTLKKSTDKHYFAAIRNNVLIGSTYITDCHNTSCSVGLFLGKNFRGNGIELAYFSQLYVFNYLNLKKITIKVHIDNKNAIDYNVFLGFKLYHVKGLWLSFRLLNKKINDYENFTSDCIKNYKLNKYEYREIYETFR